MATVSSVWATRPTAQRPHRSAAPLTGRLSPPETVYTIALKQDGTLWAWGYNNDGQLGLGDTTNRSTPTQVGSAS